MIHRLCCRGWQCLKAFIECLSYLHSHVTILSHFIRCVSFMQPYAHSGLCFPSSYAMPSAPYLHYPSSTKRSPGHPGAGPLLQLGSQIRPKTKISMHFHPGYVTMGLPRLNIVFPVFSSLVPPHLLLLSDQSQLHVVSRAQYLLAC